MTAARDAVLAELRREEGFLVELAQQLVRIPTVNPKLEAGAGLNHEADLQYYLRTVLDGFGMRTENTEVFPGRPNLYAMLPGADARSLILCGHVDVEPVGETGKWRVAPFGGAVADGRLHGRGAYGAKGGIAAAVAVARAVARTGVALSGRLELHVLVDGLCGGFGARDLVRRGRRADAVIALAPTGEALALAQCGVEWVRVVFRGRKAAAGSRHLELFPQADRDGRTQAGVNALEIAARFIAAVQHLERDWTTRKPAHWLLPPGCNTIQPGAMQAGASGAPGGFPLVGGNPATVPDVAAVDFDLRYLPDEIAADIRADFEDFVNAFAQQDSWLRENPPRVQWDLHGVQYPPINTPSEHRLPRSIVDIRAARGEETRIVGHGEMCDAAHYAGADMPALLFGPRGAGRGATDEYVELESLFAVAETLAATAVAWCGVK